MTRFLISLIHCLGLVSLTVTDCSHKMSSDQLILSREFESEYCSTDATVCLFRIRSRISRHRPRLRKLPVIRSPCALHSPH